MQDRSGLDPSAIARVQGHQELAQYLQLTTESTDLMSAVILRQPSVVEQLLHDGADPTAKLCWEDGQFWGPGHEEQLEFWGPSTAAEHYTVLDLAQNNLCHSAQKDWSAEVCLETVEMVQRSLVWSRNDTKAHYLFPPNFRRVVRHILGLKVALDRMEPAITFSNMSESLWMMVIEHIDRGDDHWFDCELTSD